MSSAKKVAKAVGLALSTLTPRRTPLRSRAVATPTSTPHKFRQFIDSDDISDQLQSVTLSTTASSRADAEELPLPAEEPELAKELRALLSRLPFSAEDCDEGGRSNPLIFSMVEKHERAPLLTTRAGV